MPLRQADRDAVAALDAGVAQAAGDARRALPQLAVAERRAADLEQRRRGRVALDARAQHRDQRGGRPT